MSSPAGKDPKQELNEIYQKLNFEPPRYVPKQESAEGPDGTCQLRWICELHVAAIKSKAGEEFPATITMGEGKKINQAKTVAAKEALSLIKDSKVLEVVVPKTEQHISRIIDELLNTKSGRGHLEVAAPLLLARQWLDGWVPLTYLLQTAKIKKWLTERHAHSLKNSELMVRVLRQQLREESQSGFEEGVKLLLSEDGLSVKVEIIEKEGNVAPTLPVEVDEGRMVAVMLPAEPGQQLQEVPLDSTASPLRELSSLLSCNPQQLVTWNHAGPTAFYIVNPRDLLPLPPTTRDAAQDSLISDMEPAVSSGRTAADSGFGEGTSRLKSTRGGPLRQMSVGSPRAAPVVKKMMNLSTAATDEHKGPAAMDWDPDALTEVAMQHQPAEPAAPSTITSPNVPLRSLDSVSQLPPTTSNSTEIEIKRPTVYSVVADLPPNEADTRPINMWASWLTGQPVRGPAVVSLVRCTLVENKPTMCWRGYPWTYLWRTITGLFPVSQYTQGLNVKILGRLPQKYSSSWLGVSPLELLRQYCARNAWRCGVEPAWVERRSDTGEESQPVVGTLAVTAFGTGQVLEETTDCQKNMEDAKQEAALKLLHRLQDIDAATLMGYAVGFGAKPEWVDRADLFGAYVDVIDGDSATSARAVKPGSVVKVNYKLFVTSDDLPADTGLSFAPATYVFEERDHLSFALGTGAVASCLEKLVEQCPVGGTVQSRGVSVCLDGADPLGVSSPSTCQLQLSVLEQSRPTVKGQAQGPKLFSPSLAQQRYDFIAQTCRNSNAKFLVDLGCGEGALVDYLVRNAGDQVERVYGMDISQTALASARKKLDKLAQLSVDVNGAATDGNRALSVNGAVSGASRVASSRSHSVETQLFHGNLSDISLVRNQAWGALQSCDIAVLVEVIEHLEEDVLQLLGPTVLGGLHPHTVVISTPNWEYNQVLRAAQTEDLERGWPGPPGRDGLPLRNSDHKFEWDRAEFRTWCQSVAQAFGYHVTFHGIGSAIREDEILSSSSWSGPRDVGCASQAAVFTRVGRVTSAITPHSDPVCMSVPQGRELPVVEDDAGSVEGSWEGENLEDETREEVQGQFQEAMGETNQSNKRSTPVQEPPSPKHARVEVEII